MEIDGSIGIVNSIDERLSFVNSSLENLFGYAAGELNGFHFSKLIKIPNDPDRVLYAEIARSLMHRSSWNGEAYGVRKDGSTFPANFKITSVSEKGDVALWLVVASDSNAAKKDRELLLEMAIRIGHEINNPLSIIRATAEDLSDLVLEKRADDSTLRRGLARIEVTVERIAKILRELRSFAQEVPSKTTKTSVKSE